MADPSKGRIAIKFGTSSSTPKRPRPDQPPSSLGKRPRHHHALGGNSDSESDDDDGGARGRHETITGFGADGAETEQQASRKRRAEKKEFVIARQPNRDWRAEMKAQRRSRNGLPAEARAQQNGATVETEPADQDKGLKWGLTIKEKPLNGDAETTGAPRHEVDSTPQNGHREKTPPLAPRTADDAALDALLGKAPPKEKAVIHAPTEDDVYQRDVETAGAAPTLADYEAMPVEEFGAALLRGMGWDGEARGPKPREAPRRRQNRLGLGAKELKESEDLGGWDQARGKKRARPSLAEYRREEEKKKEGRVPGDSYKREREREVERERDRRHGGGDRDKHRDRHRDDRRGYDRDRRR